jgi:hypothetical protein
MDRKKDPFEQLAQGPSAKFENTPVCQKRKHRLG